MAKGHKKLNGGHQTHSTNCIINGTWGAKKNKKKMNGTVYRILSRTKCIINGTVYHCPGHSAGLIEIIISQITHCRILSSMCSHLAKDWTQLSGLPLTGFKLSIFFKKYHMYTVQYIISTLRGYTVE